VFYVWSRDIANVKLSMNERVNRVKNFKEEYILQPFEDQSLNGGVKVRFTTTIL
jgi:hypothetical protein